MNEPISRYFESSRLRLHYVVWGDEAKPPLLLVHGTRDHARSWDFVAQRMLDEFCVYAPDLRGHGDSEWAIGSSYGVSAYTADLARLVEVVDRGPISLVAHSLGGRIALDYASIHSEVVKRLVAIEGFGRVGSTDPATTRLRRYVESVRDIESRTPRTYATIGEAEERMQEANKRLSEEMVSHLTKHAVRRLDDGSYAWKFDTYTYLAAAPEWSPDETIALWERISSPTLHVGGSESWGIRHPDGREVLTQSVPNAETIIVNDAGHWVHHDQLDEFLRIAREFLLK